MKIILERDVEEKTMQSIRLFCLITFLLGTIAFSQEKSDEFPTLKGPYLGQKPPGMNPEVFAPEVFSNFKYTFCSVFSPDGKEYYFAGAKSDDNKAGIYWMRSMKDKWTKPEPAPFNSPEINHDMRFSADGSKIFFQSWRPLPGSSTSDKTGCLWFSTRIQNGWSEPQPVKCEGKILRVGYPDISRNGTLYFSMRDKNTRNVDIHCSCLINGAYASPENLGNQINTEHIEGDLCVSPDEQFIIVSCWERPDNTGGGRSDLYISFRQSDGTWTRLINMGKIINTQYIENCPTISPDERYFFFQRFDGIDKSDTFWVDAKIIEDLKPELK